MRALLVGLLFVSVAVLGGAGKPVAQLPAPPLDKETGRYLYQGVVPVEGVLAPELYSRAKSWVAETYRSAKDVLQLDDRESGKLIAKGSFSASGKGLLVTTLQVDHALTIEVKDGRYRYTLGHFGIGGPTWSMTLEEWAEKQIGKTGRNILADIDKTCQALIAGLQEAMLKPSPAAAGDSDW